MFQSLPRPKHSDARPTFSFSQQKSTKPKHIPQSTTVVKKSSNDIDLHVNPDGTLDYSLTIASLSNKNVQASHQDTIPLKKKYPNLRHYFPRYTLETCPDDSLRKVVNETRLVIEKLLGNHEVETNDTNYITYNSSNVVNNDDTERVIQIHTVKEDPLLPPKFKLRKNRHENLPPPAPIIKDTSLESKLTKEDKEKWNIPAAISNWKNNQGFTIALDKRVLAANGGNATSTPEINLEGFSDLSKALESADKQARQDIKLRNEALKIKAARELQEKEEQLRQLAELARKDRDKKRHSTNYHDRKRQKFH